MNNKILNILIILLISASAGIAIADTNVSNNTQNNFNPLYSPFFNPYYPYFMFANSNGNSDMFMNYMIWSMVWDSPSRSSFNTYNLYSVGSTYTSYVPEGEAGWSVRSPIEEKIVESVDGELTHEELGYIEPDNPEGYVPIEEHDGLTQEEMMHEAETSHVVDSQEGVENPPAESENLPMDEGSTVDTMDTMSTTTD
jgi:hypothetical protein